MIKVSVMYPNNPNTKFDIDYYCNTHLPLVADCLGDALKGGAVDHGIAGGAPDEGPAFIAMGHMLFDTVEDFQNSFGPNAEKIMGDLPNFTNEQPVLQISEVKV